MSETADVFDTGLLRDLLSDVRRQCEDALLADPAVQRLLRNVRRACKNRGCEPRLFGLAADLESPGRALAGQAAC